MPLQTRMTVFLLYNTREDMKETLLFFHVLLNKAIEAWRDMRRGILSLPRHSDANTDRTSVYIYDTISHPAIPHPLYKHSSFHIQRGVYIDVKGKATKTTCLKKYLKFKERNVHLLVCNVSEIII